jgi:hypothetical protein
MAARASRGDEADELILGPFVPWSRPGQRCPRGDLAPQVSSRIGEYSNLHANAEVTIRVVELVDAHGEIEAFELALGDHRFRRFVRLAGGRQLIRAELRQFRRDRFVHEVLDLGARTRRVVRDRRDRHVVLRVRHVRCGAPRVRRAAAAGRLDCLDSLDGALDLKLHRRVGLHRETLAQAVQRRSPCEALESDSYRLTHKLARIHKPGAQRRGGVVIVRRAERKRRIRAHAEVVELPCSGRILQAFGQELSAPIGTHRRRRKRNLRDEERAHRETRPRSRSPRH